VGFEIIVSMELTLIQLVTLTLFFGALIELCLFGIRVLRPRGWFYPSIFTWFWILFEGALHISLMGGLKYQIVLSIMSLFCSLHEHSTYASEVQNQWNKPKIAWVDVIGV
jgi:hypothetical protein